MVSVIWSLEANNSERPFQLEEVILRFLFEVNKGEIDLATHEYCCFVNQVESRLFGLCVVEIS